MLAGLINRWDDFPLQQGENGGSNAPFVTCVQLLR
jgi:hypothetical protein